MKGIHILVFILILNSLIPVFAGELDTLRDTIIDGSGFNNVSISIVAVGEKGVKQMMIITIQSIVMESFWIQLQ